MRSLDSRHIGFPLRPPTLQCLFPRPNPSLSTDDTPRPDHYRLPPCQPLLRLHQHAPRSLISPLPDHYVPRPLKHRHPAHDHARVVHRGGIERHRRWETIDDDPDSHVSARQRGDGVEHRRGHGEGSADDVRPAGKDVGRDEGQVRATGHDDERPDESRKGGAIAHVDGAEQAVEHGAGERRVERVLLRGVYAADPRAAWCGVVAAQRPQHAARGDVCADVCAEGGEVDDDEEAEGAGNGVGGLAVEVGEGEWPGIREEGVEVIDAVEDGDDVEEGSEEADDILSEDGFGYVDAWLSDFFSQVRDAVTVKSQYGDSIYGNV